MASSIGHAVEGGPLLVIGFGGGDHFGPGRFFGAVDAVGADGLELVTPHDAGRCHVDEGASVEVEINLVQKYVSTFAGEGSGVARKGDDAGAVREGADVGGDIFLGVDDLDVIAVHAGGDDIGAFAPFGHVVGYEFAGGDDIA